MSILYHLDRLEESKIYKLEFEGKVLGLRVKYYNIEVKDFCYYDFEISYVQRQDLRDFLNAYSRQFENLELISYNSLLCTQDEIDGKITVQEFKDMASVHKIIDIIKQIMEVS